jgi:hypothetical protein
MKFFNIVHNTPQISSIVDEWMLYQSEEIPENWAVDDETKNHVRLDQYFLKVFAMEYESGQKKFANMAKVYLIILIVYCTIHIFRAFK